MRRNQHAAAYYAWCAGVALRDEPLRPSEETRAWARRFWRARGLGSRVLAMHPGSGSPAKNWEGMEEVARWWRARRGGQVLVLTGPAEGEEKSLPAHDAVARGVRLDRVAALLTRAHLFLGNDSGLSHLAGAVRAPGLVLFGPTDPEIWRPLGDTLRAIASPRVCAVCPPHRFCTHRATVASVQAGLDAMGNRSARTSPGG